MDRGEGSDVDRGEGIDVYRGEGSDLVRGEGGNVNENLTIFFLYGHFGVLKLRSLFILLVYRYKSFFGLKKKTVQNLLEENLNVKRTTCFASIKSFVQLQFYFVFED